MIHMVHPPGVDGDDQNSYISEFSSACGQRNSSEVIEEDLITNGIM